MLAKLVLPLLGGTPAVWNTCMVFFQAMLLLGYAYAHWVGKRLNLRRQLIVHVGLLLLAALALPISLSAWTLQYLPSEANPSAWLLGCLLMSAGLPFLAVSSNGPLLQRWFSHSFHPSAQDPYFLYASSNLGSLIALLSYPLVFEPHLRLGGQSQCWSAGFLVLVALIFACGIVLLRANRLAGNPGEQSDRASQRTKNEAPVSAVTARQRLRWCVLAVVPSSLMLGVTTY